MSFRFLPNTAVAASTASKDSIYTYAQTYRRDLVEIKGKLTDGPQPYVVTGKPVIIDVTGAAPAKRFTPLAAVCYGQKRYLFYVDDSNYLCDVHASDDGTWVRGNMRDKAWQCAAYSKLAAIKMINAEKNEFLCVYYQDTSETGDIKVVHRSPFFGWQEGNAPVNDPPLYGTSISVVIPQAGIEVKQPDKDIDTIHPVIFFQYDNLNLGSSQDQGPNDYATYTITDGHFTLSAHASLAAVDDGNNFWCFYTADSNQVFRLRVDQEGNITQSQPVALEANPIPHSPLVAVLVNNSGKDQIVLFYLLHNEDMKGTTRETNVFATTLTAETSPAADSWDVSRPVCLAPAAPTYAITGIKTGTTKTSVPLRLEVDDWYLRGDLEHKRQRSLFLYALRALQNKDPEEKLSFFQIAGIHGMPYTPWDEDTVPTTDGVGYCTHDSLLFPCWHRPYMMLFEQVLHEIMINDIIPELPKTEQASWTDAANTWRLPYWDWAEKKTRNEGETPIYDVPLITKESRILVINLKDVQDDTYIDNPMYKFTVPGNKNMGRYGVQDVQDDDDFKFSECKGTSRWADYPPKHETTWVNGQVNNSSVATALDEHSWYGKNVDNVPIAEMVYRLYSPDYITTFTQFATTKLHDDTAPAPYLNLEYIHNNIHNWTGGFDKYIGHMTEPPVAAFDPIFYMHHANVDRQFAIWQAINQENTDINWFQNDSEQLPDDGTWSIRAGDIDKPTTWLTPFHKDTFGTYFTSNDVRDWIKWGYSYPELQPWLDKYKTDGKFDVDLYIIDIRDQLKKLYSPADLIDSADKDSTPKKKWTKDIIVNITYDRFALGGVPYTLHLFIGDKSQVDNYDGALQGHPQHVGLLYTFSNPVFGAGAAQGGCEGCRVKSTAGTKSRGQVPITAALMARIPPSGVNRHELGTPHGIHPFPREELEERAVEEYLEKHLHWRVRTLSGNDVAIPETEPFVKVAVYHRDARFDHVDHAVQYKRLARATNTKLGGHGFAAAA
ncbi:tyrosinase [Madurella fahalii]|uniref:tyrosinase n=1 Tax=Madurella fahalii TaxID=1157608 RepID=A0ABQ0G513_9PEZI